MSALRAIKNMLEMITAGSAELKLEVPKVNYSFTFVPSNWMSFNRAM
jgi:hypothetical protein